MLLSMLSVLLATTLAMSESMTQEQAVILAKQAASKQLAVPDQQITLERAEAVDWSDSSLGCPEPGVMYLQVITPGYKVLLKAGGKTYPVHVGGARAIVCARSTGDLAGPKAKAAQAKVELLNRARERLAATLKVDAASIQVHGIQADPAAIGCAGNANPNKTGGKLVELEYAGRLYEYRSDSDEVQECPIR